jgi:hypothetical protein
VLLLAAVPGCVMLIDTPVLAVVPVCVMLIDTPVLAAVTVCVFGVLLVGLADCFCLGYTPGNASFSLGKSAS